MLKLFECLGGILQNPSDQNSHISATLLAADGLKRVNVFTERSHLVN